MCYHLVIKVRSHHLWVLLEIFLRPLCFFRTWTFSILLPLLRIKGSHKGNVFPRCGRKKTQSDLVTFSFSPFMFMHYLFVLLSSFWVSLVLWFVCFFMFLFGCFLVFALFVFVKKKKKYKNSVCLCVLVLVYLRWPLKQNFLNFVSLVA